MKKITIDNRNRLLQLGDSNIKKLFLLVLFLTIYNGYSQGEISTELPEIIPPSPTVAGLMKFEEMPVDYYTGIPDISVPLISTSIDSKLNLNIALNYHPSGIRVDEYASWVGTGWSLSGTGGVVTRMVKGAPDETGIFVNNYYSSSPSQNSEIFNEISYDALYVGGDNDTQADVFHFSFLGHSGKFIFTKNSSGNFVAVDLSGTSNLKINYIGNAFEKFVITDENGYRYTFDKKETSIILSVIGTTHWIGDPQLSDETKTYVSAWHLSKIESHTGQLLCEFSYETVTEKTKSVSNKKNELYPIEQIQSILPGASPGYAHRENLLPITEAGNYLSEISTQKITEINIIGRSKILFENTKGRLDYEQNSGCKLSHIVVKNNQDDVINTYSLVYSNQGVANRLFLDELKTYGQDGIAYDSHKFDYKNASNLPARFSLRTDLWGYYNNIANQTLFPHFTFLPSSGTANKSTRPEFVTTGVLTGIEYPTGGYKEFEFESNTYAVVTSEPDRKYDHPDNNTLHLTLAQFHFDPAPSGTNILNSKIIHQDLSTSISFYLSVISSNSNPNANLSAYKVRLIPLNPNYNYTGIISQDINDYQVDSLKLPLEFSLNDCGVNLQQCSQSFYIQGFYLITMSNNGIIPENDDKVSYSVSCSFFEYVENYKYSYGGGVRIKSIGFKDNKNDLAYKRKYSYSYQDFNDITKSSGSIHAFPVYSYQIKRYFAQETTSSIVTQLKETSATYMVVNSKPLIPYIPNNGSMVGYKHVVVKDSDEGYSKYYYSSPEDFTGYQPSYPYLEITKNKDHQKGLLMKAEYYDKNNVVKKSIENFYEYSSSEIFGGRNVYMPQHFNCYIQHSSFGSSVKDYQSYKNIQSNPLPNFIDGVYSPVEDLFQHSNAEYTKGKSELSRVKTVEYNTGGSLENNVYYTYNNLNHKVAKERRSLINEYIENLYFYPLDTQMSVKPNVSSLINNNIISTPLVVQTFRNSTKLSEVETVYKNWGNNLLAPELLLASKGTNSLENRIRYEHYDDKGNPLEVRQEDGISIVYLWGYNGAYPVAKIENASYEQVVAALGTNNISEVNLSAINALRTNPSFANAMVTTYTYKPLVGVTSITDPRGYTTTYDYDTFGRLEFIKELKKDENGNIVGENILERTQYRYQN